MSRKTFARPQKPPMGRGPADRPKDFKGSMGRLLRHLRPFKIRLLLVVLFTLLSTVFVIIGPRILGNATTELYSAWVGHREIDFAYVGGLILILLVLYTLSSAFTYFQGYLMSSLSMKVAYDLRNDVIAKINRLPLKYFDTTPHGDVLSRVTNDVDTLSQTMNQGLTQIISSAATLIGVLVMMFSISWQMTLAALAIIPVTMTLMLLVVKRSQKYFTAQQESLGQVNGHIEEMYGGHTVVKAFNGEAQSVARFEKHNKKLYESAWKSQFLSGLMQPISMFVGNLGYVAICILGAGLAAAGTIAVGDIQAFIQYIRSFTQPITQMASVMNMLQQTAAAAERVFTFLEEPEETADTPKVRGEEIREGAVAFEHVRFGYTPQTTVIKDFSAKVQPGQKVAIVGPTGAGKTTVVKLLMRFYDVDAGRICVDGWDIRDLSRDDLRGLFGMVLQDTWLYHDTLMENIRYGRPDATDEEVRQAAKSAQVDRFIRTLPGSYQMVLNEEATNVSQGQKQLLTIARAILSDPKILILDEATSSVDTRTEILIQKAMDNLMQGRTSFIIAHRLSTIRNADLILCMKDGDIVEQGSHHELMEQKGFYWELYNSQFETVAEA